MRAVLLLAPGRGAPAAPPLDATRFLVEAVTGPGAVLALFERLGRRDAAPW